MLFFGGAHPRAGLFSSKLRAVLAGGASGCIFLGGSAAALAQSDYPIPYSFTTLAGNAGFYYPYGAAVDAAGNVYVADTFNSVIRKVTPGGSVSILAGVVNTPGTNDGTGSAALFDNPYGVAVDAGTNVYVADSGNNTIRKITTAGMVTTLAGLGGSSGTNDGTGSAARFYYPEGVAVDSGSNVYVADTLNNTIRKVTPAGTVTTLAGLGGYDNSGTNNGNGGAARFNGPTGVAVNGAGTIFVADYGNDLIRVVTSAGAVSTLAGLAGQTGSMDASGGNARFNNPFGVAVDAATNIYVADYGNDTIRKVTAAGAVTTLAGLTANSGFVNGTGSTAEFSYPAGVAADNAGNLYVADAGNNAIRKGGREQGALIVLSGPGTGYHAGQFSFGLAGSPGQTVVVQASGNLTNWQSIWTNSFVTGSLSFTDSQAGTFSNRFYRTTSP